MCEWPRWQGAPRRSRESNPAKASAARGAALSRSLQRLSVRPPLKPATRSHPVLRLTLSAQCIGTRLGKLLARIEDLDKDGGLPFSETTPEPRQIDFSRCQSAAPAHIVPHTNGSWRDLVLYEPGPHGRGGRGRTPTCS